jgi:DNA mismatch repair protein MutL
VRFRDPALVRGLIVGGLRHALAAAGHRASTTVAMAALGGFRAETMPPVPHRPSGGGFSAWAQGGWTPASVAQAIPGLSEVSARAEPAPDLAGFAEAPAAAPAFDPVDFPLGAARAQVHETYIVAQTRDGVVIVDQHAAHERLVYERMKGELNEGGVARQALLLPEVVELDPAEAERVISRAEELAALGLMVEAFGPGAVLVREAPALLGETNIQGLIRDIADDLAENGQALALELAGFERAAGSGLGTVSAGGDTGFAGACVAGVRGVAGVAARVGDHRDAGHRTFCAALKAAARRG